MSSERSYETPTVREYGDLEDVTEQGKGTSPPGKGKGKA